MAGNNVRQKRLQKSINDQTPAAPLKSAQPYSSENPTRSFAMPCCAGPTTVAASRAPVKTKGRAAFQPAEIGKEDSHPSSDVL
jgi:uncharacterized protein YfaQ (DUF2300 family)